MVNGVDYSDLIGRAQRRIPHLMPLEVVVNGTMQIFSLSRVHPLEEAHLGETAASERQRGILGGENESSDLGLLCS